MSFSLLQLSTTQIEALATERIPEGLQSRIAPEALPPAFVASRSLELQAAGRPEPWSTTFLIVSDEDSQIVGSCGFKSAPIDGRVEVGYGVSPTARGRGAATAALTQLVHKAFEAGATEVLAEVVPENHASIRVVRKAGFVKVGARTDEENEYVVQWLRSGEA